LSTIPRENDFKLPDEMRTLAFPDPAMNCRAIFICP
jgi:hypothetical protein